MSAVSTASSASGASTDVFLTPRNAPNTTSGRVGAPRYGPFGEGNPLLPGGQLPGLGNSFLSRLNTRLDPERRSFGLGDHIGVPLSQLEAQVTQSVARAVEGLLIRARSLRSAAATLISGTDGGAFDRRATATTSSAVAAQATDGATVTGYDVEVSQLAVAQQNVGTQLLSSLDPTLLTSGDVDFTVNGVTTTLTISITGGAGQTNLDALTEVRDQINAAGLGVEASITTTADVSQLVLTSTQTGTANGFTVADNALTGGTLAADLGIATATRAAADAVVSVNGVEQTLSENKLALDAPTGGTERVTLFFLDETDETARVDVTVALNADVVVAATQRLVGEINGLRGYVEDKPQILSVGLLARLNLAVKDLRESLAAVGVKSAASGALSVDEGMLRGALAERPDDVEQAIGSIAGLAARERSVAETVLGPSGVAFATRQGPFGDRYGKTLAETARLHNYLAAGLFVNFLA